MNDPEQKTILLVEDDALAIMVEEHLLRSCGYDVVAAKSGAEAVRIAAGDEKIALVLMDIDLGSGIDGTEAARRILAQRNLPIVFLSSHTDKEYVERVKGIAGYGYVVKNSGDVVLQSSVEMALKLFEVIKTLRTSEELYRSLFDNMLNGLAYCRMIYDQGRPRDFVYLNVNGAFESLTGLKDVIGKKVSQVVPGIYESNAELFEIYGRVALTGNPERFESYVKSLNMWFAVSVYSPEKEHFVAVFDVITDRKNAEIVLRQERDLSEKLIDAQQDTFFLFEPSTGKPVRWNKCFAEVSGYSDAEIAGMKAPDAFYDADDLHKTQKAAVGILAGGRSTMELALITKQGARIPFEYSATMVNDMHGNPLIMAIGRNITERKWAADALEQAYARLEDKISERTRELQEKVNELERFRKATVEREFRMKELRDEIEKLKSEKNK